MVSGSGVSSSETMNAIDKQQLPEQQREDFVSALKHKLRTPVLGARRAITLLIEGAFGAVNEQQLIVLEALLANAEKLSVVLENLVEIYQYENGTKNTLFQKHRVLSLIAPVVEKYLTAAHARGVSLKLATVSESLEVECDMREISTLLENLVENAIQHTRTTVTLSVEDTDGKLAFA